MTTEAPTIASASLARATSDYLAVSRGAHLYGDQDSYEAAEAAAWSRLMDEVAVWEGEQA